MTTPSKLAIIFLAAIVSTTAYGQSKTADTLTATILHHDSLFWQAYNACDVEKMELYLTDDLEFYHDKSGLTTTRISLATAIRNGMCGNPDWHLRREVMAGTVNVYPMQNTGAIISGEHIFHIRETGRDEYADGYGKFMQLWVLEDGKWKMSRIFSYDHGPAPYINKRKEVRVNPSILKEYAGTYQSANAGNITITPDGNSLRLTAKSFQSVIYPASQTIFFSRERDLQFEFVAIKGKVAKMIVHENGKVVEEAPRQR